MAILAEPIQLAILYPNIHFYLFIDAWQNDAWALASELIEK